MRSHVWRGEQAALGDKSTRQRGRKEEADGLPRKKSRKKQETPYDKEWKGKKSRMSLAAPNDSANTTTTESRQQPVL